MLVDDYRVNGRRSLARVADAVRHLRAVFTERLAVDITTDRITAYIAGRQAERAANATINRELAALKRMFRLGERAEKVAQRPYIAMLHEQNVRTGFFEADQFQAIYGHLPAYLKDLLATAYITGWRIRSELLTRQRHHVDLATGWLRLDPGETKNGDGRMFPLTPGLRAILERQLAETRTREREADRIIPWLFHRDGQPIKGFRRAWLTACRKAGVPGRIPHDFRRTAVRNLERAGVPRSAAMKMVGHKTESIYRRYAIADEAMLKESAEKLARLHQASPVAMAPPPRTLKVVADAERAKHGQSRRASTAVGRSRP
jgi:integrase